MKKLFVFSCALFLSLTGAVGQITGVQTVPGTYPTLQAAITDLNAQGVGAGGATIAVAAGYTETLSAPLLLTIATNTPNPVNPLVIQKSGAGTNPLITAFTGVSTTLDGIFILNGVNNVTIDGIDLQENAANVTPTTQMEWGYALVKTSTTNGCHFNTIKNSTVTLNKTNTASIGIYSANHTSASTTGLTVASHAGSHSYNKFYNNTVQNCYIGYSLVGYASAAPYDLYDQQNEIGVDGISTRRSLVTNFGGGATTVNGIVTINQNKIKVFNSCVDGGAGSTGAMNGIFINTATNANTDVYNDTITLTSAATTSTIIGINNTSGATGAGNTINIHHNVITGCTYPTNTTGEFRGISHTAIASYSNIYNNTVSNNSIPGTGMFSGIYYSGSSATLVLEVNINDNIVSGNAKTGTAGIFNCIYASGSTVETNCFGNQLFNNSATSSSGQVYGYYNFAVGILENVYNNQVYNLSGGTGEVIGLFVQSGTGTTNKLVYGNTIHDLTGSPAGASVGAIWVNYGLESKVYNNNVYNIINNSATGAVPAAYGINIGVNVNVQNQVFNNFISEIEAPNANNTNAAYGLWLQGTTASTIEASNNTVYLNATSVGANFGTAAIVCGTTPISIDLRGNIATNNSTPIGTGITRALVRGSTSLTNYNLLSGHNCLYAGVPSASNLVFSDGTNNLQTIQALKNLVGPREQASFSELPPFTNVAVSPYNLHILAGSPTQCESGGKASTFVTTDYDGQNRYPIAGFPTAGFAAAPDVGADEFGGNMNDIASPDIQYVLLGNSNVVANRVIPSFATITDPTGINNTPGTRPRLYYKKSTHANTFNNNTNGTDGWKFVEASNATSPFDFTMNYTLLFGGGVVAGDIIQYFVTAQDLNSTPRIGLNNGGFTVQPASVNLAAANFPLTNTINQFTIVANAYSGVIPVGPTETITSLTNAGGIFNLINSGVVSGNITISITGDLTAETGTFPLNQWAETGGSGYTITMAPSAPVLRTISGASAASSLVRFDGADRFTIDGRFAGSGTYLLFRNTSNSAPDIGFLNDAQNNTVQYSILESGNTATSTTLGGVVHIGATTGTNGNDNNTISFCEIRDRSDVAGTPAMGINCVGSTGSFTQYNNNCSFTNNNIHDWFLLNGNAQYGMNIGVGNSGFTITGNSFYQTTTRTNTVSGAVTRGINIANTSVLNNNGGFTISNNFIGGTAPGATGGDMTLTVSGAGVSHQFIGMSVITGLIPNSIQNNTISKIDYTTNAPAAAATMFAGMNLGQGIFNVGATTGNIIGGATGNDLIRITINAGGAVNSFLAGILAAGVTGYYDIQNNTIGGITISGTTVTGGIIPQWIQVQGTPAQNNVISNNLIGSTTTANSIRQIATGPAVVSFAIRNIINTGVVTTINNNTIQNLSNASTNAGTAEYGMLMISTVGAQAPLTITNNTIRNISSAVSPAAPTLSLLGISVQGYGGNGHNISDNTISSLYGTSTAGVSPYVIGIQTQGSSLGGTMSSNRIFDLRNPSTSGNGGLSGIYMSAGNGWNVHNNMISISNGANTNTLNFTGMAEFCTGTLNFHHNSVYIGGSMIGVGTNTFCFTSGNNSNLYLQNNLLYNERTGGAGTSHCAIGNAAGTPALWSNLKVNNNVFIVTDTTKIGQWGPTNTYDLPGWQTISNADNNSKRIINILEPSATVFVSTTTGDLHNSTSSFPSNEGIPVAGITVDIDTDPRSVTTPDVGADEFTAQPDIEVVGNLNIIYNGDITPGFTDSTDFGNILECTGTISKTYTIRNLGDLNLTITGVTITGTNAADFTVTANPGSPVAGGASTTFTITFDPGGVGLRTATVNIATNDADENPHTFNIQGTGDADILAPVPNAANIDVTVECSTTLTAPTATDNCVPTVTGTTGDPLTYSSQGTFVVTWTYDDGNGNTVTQTQTVTVDDVTAPATPSIPNANGECSVSVTAPTTTDNCLGTVTGTTGDPTTYSSQGIFVITWTFDDGNGNTTTATQTVNVDDVTAPTTPSIPGASGQCSVNVTAPTTTDNCSGTVTGTTGDPTSYSSQGTFVVTWTFDDGNGNTTTATQTVTVDDLTAPVADNASLPALSGCSVTITVTPTATDNCIGAITATTGDPLTYSTVGSFVVTWSYTDGNGNTTTQTQSVTVIDCSGINEEISFDLNMYPNPGNGLVTITLSQLPQGETELKLIDQLGQVLYTNAVQNLTQSYDFSYLPAATYYVQIIGKDVNLTRKLIITHKD